MAKVIKIRESEAVYCQLNPVNPPPEDLESAIASLEAIQNAEPMIGPWLIYREMSRSGIKVSLDGHGGDETLAGYLHYPSAALVDAIWPKCSVNRWRDVLSIENGMLSEDVPEGTKRRHI